MSQNVQVHKHTCIAPHLCSTRKHTTVKFLEGHKSHETLQLPISSQGDFITCEIWNTIYSATVFHYQWISAAHPHTTLLSGCFKPPRPLSLHLVHMQFSLIVSVSLLQSFWSGRLEFTHGFAHMWLTTLTPASCASYNRRNKKTLKESKWISGLHKPRALAALKSKYCVMQGLVIRFIKAKAIWLSERGTVFSNITYLIKTSTTWTGRRNTQFHNKPNF